MLEDIESSSFKNVYIIILSLNACMSPVFIATSGYRNLCNLSNIYKYFLLLSYVRTLIPPLTLSTLDRPSFVSFFYLSIPLLPT